ncbi:MAG: NPCBM/NEW2 domain-containing protein [bacterium]
MKRNIITPTISLLLACIELIFPQPTNTLLYKLSADYLEESPLPDNEKNTSMNDPMCRPRHRTVFSEVEHNYILDQRLFIQKENFVSRQMCVNSLNLTDEWDIKKINPSVKNPLDGSYTIGANVNCSPDSLDFLKWAETPPLGWNSWDCYGPTVTEVEVKANVDYMAKYLKDFGWEYIVVDIRWYVENDKAHGYNQTDPIYVMDEYGRLLPSTLRFPSAADGEGFKSLADYVHDKGLKFGIHIMRGIPKEAVKKNTPILGSKARAADIYSTELLCNWLGDMYTVVAGKEGAQEYYNSLFELYALWGIDFVKVDDLSVPYHDKEIEMIRKAIDKSGRKIVLSTSPGETPIENADHIKQHANMWRIVGDFWDSWNQLKEHFDVCKRWAPYIGNGHFPDADMLPLGRIGIRAENGNDRMCRFTKDEQITLMTLFAIFRSPLMFGGDLPSNDEFTLSLLTNKDVLHVNQFSANNKQLFRNGDIVMWAADDTKTGDKFLAVFNTEDREQIIESKAMWKSDVFSASNNKQSVDVEIDISNAKKIYLTVADAGDGSNWDHADWIEPKLIGQKGILNLTDLNWVKATSGWGESIKNKSVANNPLIVDGVEYQNGIGTHSTSVVEFDIPEGYNRFTAKAGLDKECIEHTEGASVQFMIFTQDPAGPQPANSVQVPIKLEDLDLNGSCKIKDLWSGKILGSFSDEFAPFVKRHGAGLYRISKQWKD